MAKSNRLDEEKLHQMQFALLTEVTGRWKADIIEDYLKSEEIDVVLIQEAISHVTHITAFSPVKIYVPKTSLARARNLLKTFDEAEDEPKEEANMANKKKIEIREKQLAAQRTERNIRIIVRSPRNCCCYTSAGIKGVSRTAIVGHFGQAACRAAHRLGVFFSRP